MNSEIKMRDLAFILIGLLISVVIFGLYFNYSQYLKQCAVEKWIYENRESIKINSRNGKAALLNNTGQPGSLRLIGIGDEPDKEEVIKEISYKIVVLKCPYPLIRAE